MQCVISRILRGDETIGETIRKRIVVLATPPASVVVLGYLAVDGFSLSLLGLGIILVLLPLLVGSTVVFVTKKASCLLFEVCVIVVGMGILLCDLTGASNVGNARVWSCAVLLMDVLLLGEGREWAQNVVRSSVVLWLVVCCAE
eukprot:Sspe_Gene.118456::Locus_111872_Transcript_1_1_Confidence_1.000_Length_481::g.118456::m.118456